MAMSELMINYFFKMINLGYEETCGLKMVELGNQLIGGHKRAKRLKSLIPTTKIFFECLGFDHTSIDINGKDGALPIDLTKPITDESLIGQFDIVTNVGTSEHVLDQEVCFENIDKLCKDGGIIINISPYGEDWEDHAPFWYDESHFIALALKYRYSYLSDMCLLQQRWRRERWHYNICVTFRKGEEKQFDQELSYMGIAYRGIPYYGEKGETGSKESV